jgi:hypothetical protein
MTMQYMSLQFLCRRHPFLAPNAFASICKVAASAGKERLQSGHRGARLSLTHHRTVANMTPLLRNSLCYPQQLDNRGICLSRLERIAVLPQKSQSVYIDSAFAVP